MVWRLQLVMNAPVAKLTCDQFGKRADRLLLPIDLAKCPPEIFPLANSFVKPFGGEVVLLHVLDRRATATPSTVRDRDQYRARQHLERIGREYLRHTLEASSRVRTGIPHEEIAAEAKAMNADLILLPIFAPSIWSKLTGTRHGETVRNLPQCTSGLVFVIDVRARFNCFRNWAKAEACVHNSRYDSK
jgi:nucleotide-binding universal stress UspA family protein